MTITQDRRQRCGRKGFENIVSISQIIQRIRSGQRWFDKTSLGSQTFVWNYEEISEFLTSTEFEMIRLLSIMTLVLWDEVIPYGVVVIDGLTRIRDEIRGWGKGISDGNTRGECSKRRKGKRREWWQKLKTIRQN
ncbi:hypothetical protein chiPu_0030015 [Chiloscyllium punctatum]|uniref:Uncharacterized protein n=1 Tax=Chiloscyllium punctatum TaxID=137246 RepID=A0A401TT76_CHIPU|nr:hypothetical protein [Chiloscyllium punctatum]